jgi:hypothetical protein
MNWKQHHHPFPPSQSFPSAATRRDAEGMDPCPFVRVLVGNLALKMPAPPPPSSAARSGSSAGVHPAAAPCHCRIRLDKLPPQLAAAPLLPPSSSRDDDQTGAFGAAFHLSRADLDRARRLARLKVAVYAGRSGATCGVGGAGRLLGKVVVPLDLKAAAEGKPVVFHSGWVAVGKPRRAGRKPAAAMLNLTVRAEPDPRFVFEFDGEPECSPQVMQVQGGMRQPMFSCRFSSCSSRSAPHAAGWLRSRSAARSSSDPRSWLAARLGSDRDRERKGWSVTVHDLSGSPVALASMVTPFVASPGSDRVSRSNPGAWLVLRPGDGGGGTWTPWGRLECWRERDALGYRFDLLLRPTGAGGASVCVAESALPASRGGRFAIDLTPAQPFVGSPASCSPRAGGDWPFGTFRGFVMSAAVQGEGRCSRPRVEVGVAHVACAEDAAAFVALAAAVDLSMDACRLFSCRLRRELSAGDL